MMLLYIIQVIAFVAGLILIVPVRFIKSKYFEKRITVLDWIWSLGKANREMLNDMVQSHEDAQLLYEESLQRNQELSDRLHRFWNEGGAHLQHAVLDDATSPWKPVSAKPAGQSPEKENGSDDDDAKKDATK